ncbi:sigma factor-like helix-turn-helix DNA-binding protein [Demequina sp. NBRC 110053]|uniref:sigma factor-like helix-turn-helix DNA-binding protein n=1 Tax=Demequina sp. NBRC 110053 TaxID=1570342 RepID=UPI0009FE3A34|nr:sigma factor-like helix-turn-helix DNA-binding protein [Demequina sp. NBRC 110053]
MRSWVAVLDALVRERRGALVGYASVLSGDRAAAEELVDGAVVRTFSRVRGVADVAHAEVHVKHEIRHRILHARRHGVGARAARQRVAAPDVAPAGIAIDEHDDLRRAVAGLSPRQRACVLLRFYDDLPVASVADELGLGLGTVERCLRDAVERLRAALGVDVGRIDVGWDEQRETQAGRESAIEITPSRRRRTR